MADEYRPVFVNTDQATDLRNKGSTYVDAFARQLQEIFFIDNPALAIDKRSALTSADFKNYAETQNEPVYVYYPWNGHLVKTVGADRYFRLKTNRNQDLITADEQTKLYAYRVGVFGLSVGSNIAFALTQAGISREIVLADYDALDTTNLNRIFAGVHQVGINKAIVAARRIYEDDPFADVEVLECGIDASTLEKLLAEKRADCIVEEVDDMPFKLEARKLALKHRVPVVMVTDNGDGVVLHVERYDLGWQKIFGKEPSYFDQFASSGDKETIGKFIMNDIVGGVERVDPAMLASVRRVLAGELVSWSQLGTAALLGGVVATYIIKQIALGKNTEPDIRAYISPTSVTWGTH